MVPLVHHYNPVRIHDGADTLGYDYHSGISRLFGQCLAQGGIRLEIQGGKTVVKHIYFRLSDNGPGNCQALPLTA